MGGSQSQPPRPSPISPDRITLRPFSLLDLDDFFVWASDPDVARFFSWEPYPTKESLLPYLQTFVLPHPWFRAVCLDGRPVGYVSVIQREGSNRCRGELGYALASAHWGKGIIPVAVGLVVGAVFGDLPGLERVEAVADVENRGSQRVLEKAGFTKEGVLRKYWCLKGTPRDMVMYSFLDTDR